MKRCYSVVPYLDVFAIQRDLVGGMVRDKNGDVETYRSRTDAARTARAYNAIAARTSTRCMGADK